MYSENHAVAQIERHYMRKPRRNTYIALEELDYTWDWSEVQEFIRMWKEDMPFEDIAGHFERDPDEVALLLMDLARKGRIKPRKRGIH